MLLVKYLFDFSCPWSLYIPLNSNVVETNKLMVDAEDIRFLPLFDSDRVDVRARLAGRRLQS
jgi:hypothetical protein